MGQDAQEAEGGGVFALLKGNSLCYLCTVHVISLLLCSVTPQTGTRTDQFNLKPLVLTEPFVFSWVYGMQTCDHGSDDVEKTQVAHLLIGSQ